MRHIPEDLFVKSELIEPAFMHIIGHLFAQAEHLKEKFGNESAFYVDAMENLWSAIVFINRLTNVCEGATHASIAANNVWGATAKAIEKELGFSPIKEDTDNNSFRNLVPFEIDFGCIFRD